MLLSLLTDPFDFLSFPEMCAWCESKGIGGLELGVGGAYSPAPHVSSQELLSSAQARAKFQSTLEASRLKAVGFNAGGNPLHPNTAIAEQHNAALRDAVRAAAEVGVPNVVAMSGCPGAGAGESGEWPVFAGGAWLSDMEGLWDRQWPIIGEYWAEMSEWAATEAPGVAICLELHPGTSIYNAESFTRLKQVTGDNIRVNLDPSHFWWQQMDPVECARALGADIAFVHGKDTKLYPERIALHGVLDFRWPASAKEMSWHFCSVGHGRPVEEWAQLLRALDEAGYAGPVSIEHEDPILETEAAVTASVNGLEQAMRMAGISPLS